MGQVSSGESDKAKDEKISSFREDEKGVKREVKGDEKVWIGELKRSREGGKEVKEGEMR